MLEKLSAILDERLPGARLDSIAFAGDDRLQIAADALLEVCTLLKNDEELAFHLLSDLTVVDYPDDDLRFEVIHQLYSLKHRFRLRLKTRVAEGTAVASVSTVWAVAESLEREAHEMFGVVFEGHPGLKHLLLYDEFEGHPLRKDYPLKKQHPIVELRVPIETTDDPIYFWDKFQKRRKLDLDD